MSEASATTAAPTRSESLLLAAAIAAPVVLVQGVLLTARIVAHPTALLPDGGFVRAAALVLWSLWGEVAFALACSLLVAVRAQRSPRWYGLALLLQLAGAALITLDVVSFGYFQKTLESLDAPLLRHFVASPHDLWLIVSGEASTWEWVVLGSLAVAELLLPWALLWRARHSPTPPWRGRERRARPVRRAWLRVACSVPVALLGAMPVPVKTREPSLVRSPVLQVGLTAVAPYQAPAGVDLGAAATQTSFFEPGQIKIRRTREGLKRNLVFVLLESTRARSVTPYEPSLRTTPFLARLAEHSLLVEKAYVVIPSTAKALTATFCSIHPSVSLEPRALNAKLLGRCLPQLLQEEGYQTVFFQTADGRFENRRRAIPAMGFQQFVEVNDLPHEGFEEANFLGVEDAAILGPSRDWLRAHKDKPFFAAYLTVDAHHDYNRLTRYGVHHFATNGDDALDRYLNNLYAQDKFLEQLFADYRRLGLLDNTLFVVLGDHGEGFGEHGRGAHNSVVYEEGARIPLLFHDPSGELPAPGRKHGPVSQLDVMPSALDLLGYEVSRGHLHGSSIFAPHPPQDRVLMLSCATGTCVARVTDSEKFIHHFDRRPDELFDLSQDPTEQHDLAPLHPELIQQRRAEVVAFHRRLDAFFFTHELHARRE